MAKKIEMKAPEPQSINEGAQTALNVAPKKKDTRRQLGIKVSSEIYDDLQVIEQIHKSRGEPWNMTMIGAQLLADYVEEHRAEIERYKELIKSL